LNDHEDAFLPAPRLAVRVPLSLLRSNYHLVVAGIFRCPVLTVAANPSSSTISGFTCAADARCADQCGVSDRSVFFYGRVVVFAFSGSCLAAAMLTFKPHLGFAGCSDMIADGK